MDNSKWADDDVFTAWLVSMKYARKTKKGIEPIIGLGLVLYCFEAYHLGKSQK